MERPICKCHGERMLWHVSKRYRAGGFWYCGERNRETKRERYENLTGLEYNGLLLQKRRVKTLARMRSRHDSMKGG